ncbi:MAG: cysteine peptidase family C39 domain-containing protein [Bacteroidales bacterium]|nr:cysteine peptidase family C39 domain-containing protein [Bacteroidales bacterium]
MKKKEIKKLASTGCFQQDVADCGVACLSTVMRYYGKNISLEQARELSGTNAQGTTMLGLYITAQQQGFEPQGYEIEPDVLKSQNDPIIVHTLLPNGLQHFMVYCGFEKNEFIVFDPFKGITNIPENEFLKIYTKKCLLVKPLDNNFKREKPVNKIVEFLKDYIKTNKATFASLILISILVAVSGMSTSVLFQKLIDSYLPDNLYNKIYAGIVFVCLLLIVKVLLNALKQLLIVKNYKEIQENLVDKFFNKLFSLKLGFFESRKIGDLAARLNDIRRIQSIVTYIIGGNTVIDIFLVVVGCCITGYYAWQMPIIIILILAISFFYILKTNGEIISKQRNMMVDYSNLESKFINSVKNIRFIKVGNMSDNFVKVNNILFQKFTGSSYVVDKLQIKLSCFYGIINVVLTLGSLIFCAISYQNEIVSIGEFIAIVSIVSLISPSIINLSLLPVSFNEAKTAFDRFFSTIDLKSENLEGDDLKEINEISLNKLNFGFIGRKQIINNLDAVFTKGKVNCLVGKSGCGKSTLCKLLEKSYLASNNSILVNGKDLNSINTIQYRSKIGIIPQNIQMFEGSILENICIGINGNPQEIYQKVIEVCTKYDLLNYLQELPNSLMTIVGEAGIELSGGEKQFVNFIKILVQNPQIMIFDEPTSAMDTQMSDKIWQIIFSLSQENIVILVTHQLNMLEKYSENLNVVKL